MFKHDNADWVFVGIALIFIWAGMMTLSTLGALMIIFALYWVFERGPEKGFIKRRRKQ